MGVTHEDCDPAGRRHRTRDRRAGAARAGRPARRRARRRHRDGADGRRRLRCRADPLPPDDADARAGSRRGRCWAPSAVRTTTRCRARCVRSRGSCASARRSGCSPTCGPRLLYPELAAASTLKAGGRRGTRPPDRARADRRHLLRPAARPAASAPDEATKASTRCTTACRRSSASPASASRRRASAASSSARSTRPTCSTPASCGAKR